MHHPERFHDKDKCHWMVHERNKKKIPQFFAALKTKDNSNGRRGSWWIRRNRIRRFLPSLPNMFLIYCHAVFFAHIFKSSRRHKETGRMYLKHAQPATLVLCSGSIKHVIRPWLLLSPSSSIFFALLFVFS